MYTLFSVGKVYIHTSYCVDMSYYVVISYCVVKSYYVNIVDFFPSRLDVKEHVQCFLVILFLCKCGMIYTRFHVLEKKSEAR